MCPDIVGDKMCAVMFFEEYFKCFCCLYVSNDGRDCIEDARSGACREDTGFWEVGSVTTEAGGFLRYDIHSHSMGL